jgi:hypothetical protein
MPALRGRAQHTPHMTYNCVLAYLVFYAALRGRAQRPPRSLFCSFALETPPFSVVRNRDPHILRSSDAFCLHMLNIKIDIEEVDEVVDKSKSKRC